MTSASYQVERAVNATGDEIDITIAALGEQTRLAIEAVGLSVRSVCALGVAFTASIVARCNSNSSRGSPSSSGLSAVLGLGRRFRGNTAGDGPTPPRASAPEVHAMTPNDTRLELSGGAAGDSELWNEDPWQSMHESLSIAQIRDGTTDWRYKEGERIARENSGISEAWPTSSREHKVCLHHVEKDGRRRSTLRVRDANIHVGVRMQGFSAKCHSRQQLQASGSSADPGAP